MLRAMLSRPRSNYDFDQAYTSAYYGVTMTLLPQLGLASVPLKAAARRAPEHDVRGVVSTWFSLYCGVTMTLTFKSSAYYGVTMTLDEVHYAQAG